MAPEAPGRLGVRPPPEPELVRLPPVLLVEGLIQS